jgi:hypothetical protein
MRALLSLILATSMAAAAAAERRHAVAPPSLCFSAVLAQAASQSIVTDSDSVFYADFNSVYRVGKTGGVPVLLVSFACCSIDEMAADDNTIYVAVQPFGDAIKTREDPWLRMIYAIPKSGGAAVMLASGVWLVKQFAAADGFVYWASLGTVLNDPEFASDGKIERVRKDGTERTTLASGLSGPTSVAIDDAFVYFAESGLARGNSSRGARRVPKEGGVVQRLYNLAVDFLALNGNDLYMVAENDSRNTITQALKNGTQIKRTFNDLPIINPRLTIFDGRVYYITETKLAFAVASVTLDLQGRTLYAERLFNSSQIGVDACAIYISTIEPADFEIERVMK